MLDLKSLIFKICLCSICAILTNSSVILAIPDVGYSTFDETSTAKEEGHHQGGHHAQHHEEGHHGNTHMNHSGNKADFHGGSHQNIHGGNTLNNMHGSGYHGRGNPGNVNINGEGGQNNQPQVIVPDYDQQYENQLYNSYQSK